MSDDDRRGRLFLGCFIALVATAFGFLVRGAVLGDWERQFGLSEEEKGMINGVGLFPFAISIILFSLIVDKIGYGRSMAIAFTGHVASTLMTIFASDFRMLYIATFIYALSNGVVEAVVNPVVATVYRDNKTKWLNILHAGWPGGLVLGGLLSILILTLGERLGASLPGQLWQWQMAVLLLPILAYGALLFGLRFPVQERVQAGVSYQAMLREFGWGSALIVSFLIIMGISQVLKVFGVQPIDWKYALAFAVVPAVLFAIPVKSFGRPMFVFMLLVMFLLATTELGTDGWIQDIMGSVLKSPVLGTLFLVYTSAIMFALRFFAGPIVHRISPLGLLALSSALACAGLLWLGNAGTGAMVLFLAATLYAFGKAFFWPTTLGVVSEQYPKGGALLLNTMGGVGMIAVGAIGGPAIGTMQDIDVNRAVVAQAPDLGEQVTGTNNGMFFAYDFVDPAKVASLSEEQKEQLVAIQGPVKQHALAKIALLPAIMFVCYLALIVYFKSRGGYAAEVLVGHAADDEKFTGGTSGPGEG
jgi:MFS family permease